MAGASWDSIGEIEADGFKAKSITVRRAATSGVALCLMKSKHRLATLGEGKSMA